MEIRTSVFFMLCLFICAGLLLAPVSARETMAPAQKKTVVIDAGHGGFDPGKVGVNGVCEKELNLKIALLLKEYLEKEDIQVVMTRTEDVGLYKEGSSNKKAEDMRNRVALAEEGKADFLVSIHQNSYETQSCRGAQVFYYKNSTEGEKLAASIQRRLIEIADPENSRQAKSNDSYYMLEKSAVPAVICECGFLSNPQECEKLCTEEYQKLIAKSIYMGIMDYIGIEK